MPITKTDDELSVVCLENQVPQGVKVEGGWKGLKVEGPLDFELTGILASLATPLAQAKISIFAMSTFDTDYIMVKKENLKKTISVLSTFCISNECPNFSPGLPQFFYFINASPDPIVKQNMGRNGVSTI